MTTAIVALLAVMRDGWMVGALLALTAVPFLAASLYLGVLAALARHARPRWPHGAPRTRFDVLVPAHNEESGIAATLASLASLQYPPELYRVLVIADNCSDDTAERVRASGGLVLERVNATQRGKGHALAFAYEASLAHGFAEAIVVVDADTSVSPRLLKAFDAALADGHEVLQGDYGVRNIRDSWRTRLVRLAFVLFHGVRSSARERLGLSCGLRGNGMCFRTDVLRRVPHSAFSIVEDLEYGIQLGLAGIRVAYVAEARVTGDMPATATASRSQRARWEGGRRIIRRRYTAPLLRAAMNRRSPMLLDLSFDLLIPPLSTLAATVAAGWSITIVAAAYGLAVEPALWLWSLAIAAMSVYVTRGCVMSGVGARIVADLMWAPVYVIWKFMFRSRNSKTLPGEWVRTSRAPLRQRG